MFAITVLCQNCINLFLLPLRGEEINILVLTGSSGEVGLQVEFKKMKCVALSCHLGNSWVKLSFRVFWSTHDKCIVHAVVAVECDTFGCQCI